MKKTNNQRTWKDFRLDENKVYAFIGRAVVLISMYIFLAGSLVYGFLTNTVY